MTVCSGFVRVKYILIRESETVSRVGLMNLSKRNTERENPGQKTETETENQNSVDVRKYIQISMSAVKSRQLSHTCVRRIGPHSVQHEHDAH